MKKLLLLKCLLATTIMSYSQTGSEIILFNLKIKDGIVHLSKGKNITNHAGYDNQPFFHVDKKPLLFYASFDDSGRSDIKVYNYNLDISKNISTTHDREYSPTVTPDKKFLSFILQRDNGAQDLAKMPIDGGDPIVLIDNLTIGYHAWAGPDQLILFVLGKDKNTLHYYNLKTKTDTVLAENIGRSLHKIPGEKAMSFVQKISDNEILIKKINLPSLSISTIIPGISSIDHLCWLDKNTFVMSDGEKLSSYDIKTGKWNAVVVEDGASLLKGISRLAVDTGKNKIAVVVTE